MNRPFDRAPNTLKRRWVRSFVAASLFASLYAVALPAYAHIDMMGALRSRGGDQKSSPCDGRRGDGPVYTFEPGATITLALNEAIPHPSYFRIAFDDDGDDAFVEPKSIKPIEASRPCPYNANDKCGESDFCNVMSSTGGPTVLWDNLDPHSAGLPAGYSWTVKLPDVECENCTIQVLQIMEDVIHGAYCPSDSCSDTSLEDIYHRCIDITLKRGATNSPGTTTSAPNNKGIDCVAMAGGGMTAGAGGASGAGAGGASGAGAAGTGVSTAGSAGGGTAGVGAAGAAAVAGTGAAGDPGGAAGAVAGAPSPLPVAGSAAATAGGPGIPLGTAGTPPSPVAGTGAAGIGTMQSPVTGAPLAGSPATPVAPAPSDSGGCALVATHTKPLNSAWVLLAAAFGYAFNRRRRRKSVL